MCQRLLQASWPQCAENHIPSSHCSVDFKAENHWGHTHFDSHACRGMDGYIYIYTIHSVCMCIERERYMIYTFGMHTYKSIERERECKAMHTLTPYTCMLHTIQLRTAPERRSLYQSFPEMETFRSNKLCETPSWPPYCIWTSEDQKYILVTPLGNWEPPSLLPACPLCKEPLQHSCCCVYIL